MYNPINLNREKIKVLIMINFYQLIFGSILGIFSNLFIVNISNFSDNPTFKILLLFFNIIFFVTIIDLIHEFILHLPFVREYKDEKWFVYPSPIALTFAYWTSQYSIKSNFKNAMSRFNKHLSY